MSQNAEVPKQQRISLERTDEESHEDLEGSCVGPWNARRNSADDVSLFQTVIGGAASGDFSNLEAGGVNPESPSYGAILPLPHFTSADNFLPSSGESHILSSYQHNSERLAAMARLRSKEIADSVMKGLTFGGGVLAGSARVAEMKGLPTAPRVPRAALELSEAAEHVKEQTEIEHKLEMARQTPRVRATLPSIALYDESNLREEFEEGSNGDARVHLMADMRNLIPYPILSLVPSKKGKIDKLTLLSFNSGLLAYRMLGITWYQNPPFANRRLTHVPVALKATEADIIALQEVYDEKQAETIINALRSTYPFVGRRASGGCFAVHNGLLLLSKFPIIHTRFQLFKQVTWIEGAFGSKGMLEVAVDVPGIGPVTFLNVHLASGAVDPESDAIESLRNEQISQVLIAADSAAFRNEIPLIVGDMNTAPNLCPRNYNSFIDKGWKDAYILARKNAVDGNIFVSDRNSKTQLDSFHYEKVAVDAAHLQNTFYSQSGVAAATPNLVDTSEDDNTECNSSQAFKEDQCDFAKFDKGRENCRRASDGVGMLRREVVDEARLKAAPLILPSSGDSTLSSNNSGANCDLKKKSKIEFRRRSANELDACNIEKGQISLPFKKGHGQIKEKKGRPVFEDFSKNGNKYNYSENTKAILAQDQRHYDGATSDDGLTDRRRPESDDNTASSPSVENCFSDEEMRIGCHSKRSVCYNGNRPFGDVNSTAITAATCSTFGKHNSLVGNSNARTIGRSDNSHCSDPNDNWRRKCATANPRWLPTVNSSSTAALSSGGQSPKGDESDGVVSPSSSSHENERLLHRRRGNDKDSTIVKLNEEEYEKLRCDDFTWDPRNPLNTIGPHSGCHGQRCDHIFLPCNSRVRKLKKFYPARADIVFVEPRVVVEGCYMGCCGIGSAMLVTLSDHYGLRVELRRRKKGSGE